MLAGIPRSLRYPGSVVWTPRMCADGFVSPRGRWWERIRSDDHQLNGPRPTIVRATPRRCAAAVSHLRAILRGVLFSHETTQKDTTMPKNKKPAGGRPAKNFEPRYGEKKTLLPGPKHRPAEAPAATSPAARAPVTAATAPPRRLHRLRPKGRWTARSAPAATRRAASAPTRRATAPRARTTTARRARTAMTVRARS